MRNDTPWKAVAAVEVVLAAATVILDLFVPTLVILVLIILSLLIRRARLSTLGFKRDPDPLRRVVALVLVLALTACWPPPATPAVTPTRIAPTPSPAATATTAPTLVPPTPSPACLTAAPSGTWLPAGSSAQFRLAVGPPCTAERYAFRVEELPEGWAAEFLGSATPFNETLAVTPAEIAPPGSYHIRVTATSAGGLPNAAELEVQVVPCLEFTDGQYTRAMQSNLVTLITAGKPSIEHGLLVPLQVCGGSPGRRLLVTLLEAVSEAGSPLSKPPHFYLYRIRVWPAPDGITAHGVPGTLNVQLPRINSVDWQLEADLLPGLHLLVFERDRWDSSTDPQAIPTAVTYRLRFLP